MYKKVITFTDYNGVERTETHYFDLSQAEVLEMNMEAGGTLAERYQRIVDAKDTATLIKEFKTLICKSYGRRSDDGLHFYKTEKDLLDFTSSPAFSALFMELATDADAAAAFAKGIMPEVAETPKVVENKAA